MLELIDLAARPDTVQGLRDGSHFRVHCRNGHQVSADLPIVIHCPDDRLIFVPGLETENTEDYATFARLLPLILAEHSGMSVGDGGEVEIEQTTRELLPVILSEDPKIRALETAIEALLAADAGDGFDRMVADQPHLLSPPALSALQCMSDAEAKNELGNSRRSRFDALRARLERVSAQSRHAQNELPTIPTTDDDGNDDSVRIVSELIERLTPGQRNELAAIAEEGGDPDAVVRRISQHPAVLSARPAQGGIPAAVAVPSTLWQRYQADGSAGKLAHLDDAIDGYLAAIDTPGIDSDQRLRLIGDTCNALAERHLRTGHRKDLDIAIDLASEVLKDLAERHELRPAFHSTVSAALSTRSSLTGLSDDLDTAINHIASALRLTTHGDKSRPMYLNNLANRHAVRFTVTSSRGDLDQAISYSREAVRLASGNDIERPGYLSNLANNLADRFALTGSRADLDAAIHFAEDAVLQTPERHSNRPSRMHTLASRRIELYRLTGQKNQVDVAIEIETGAIHLTPDGHQDKPVYLHALANHLSERFLLNDDMADLDAAILHVEVALRDASSDYAQRSTLHDGLASHLAERFTHTATAADLDAAIGHAEAAIRCAPERHNDMPAYLGNLAAHLATRYAQSGSLVDLDAALSSAREAIRLLHDDHADRPTVLNNLSTLFQQRFRRTQLRADLEQAISHSSLAVSGWQRLILDSEDSDAISVRAAQSTRLLVGQLIAGDHRAELVRALDTGRAIRLRAELVGGGRPPANLDANDRIRYLEVRNALRGIRGELRALASVQLSEASAGNVARLREQELALRKERERLEAGDLVFSRTPLDYAATRQRAIAAQEAIVFLQPLANEKPRLLAVIVHPRSPFDAPFRSDVLIIDGFGRKDLGELLGGSADGWLTADQAYKTSPSDPATRAHWLRTLARIVSRLGQDIMQPLARRLVKLRLSRVVLLPADGLALLPLHAAPVDRAGTPFFEWFETRYAPSAAALAAAAHPIAATRLIGVANPEGSLTFADLQMRAVAEGFGNSASVRHGRAARRDWLLEQAPHADVVALSTHATFDMNGPERSFFVLANPDGHQVAAGVGRDRRSRFQETCEKLELDDILRGSFRLKRGALVVADACETGQIEIGATVEESVGFPAAFLTAGAATVIASLWSKSRTFRLHY